ncbi:MAG: 5-formyltetrahydrofolate cyclo-ligase [Microlunatus sp.]|nr:5-formyltetrahydrofolate cyclo-ligase [Microlunatus sp.]
MSADPDAVAIAAAKTMLRDAVRLRRAARAPDRRRVHDEERFARLVDLLAATGPRRLAAYLSTDDEPDSLRLVAWSRAHGLEVLLPVLTDGNGGGLPSPAWASYPGPEALREGRSRILEPTGPVLPEDALAAADLMVVPGLAADAGGHRMGRGGGWYDRAREAWSELETWVLLNDDEVLEVVPTAPWDLPVDVIVTPSRTLRATPTPTPTPTPTTTTTD